MSDRSPLRSSSTAVPIFRVVSLLFMLAVIGLTIYNLHQRASVASFAPEKVVHNPKGTEEIAGKTAFVEPGKGDSPIFADTKIGKVPPQTPQSPSAAAPAKKRKPIADEDPEQWEQFRRRSEAIMDKSTFIHDYELPAYWRVMNWVQSQSLADLQARSLPQVPFQNFLQHPGKYRGRPVRVALDIRQVQSIELDDKGKGSRPKKLYELWGVPTELDGWWYVVVTPELPPGFPLGKSLGVTTTVYGYFFKLQGYQQFDAKPDARPFLAPMIIGRVAPVTTVVAPAPPNPLSYIVLAVGGLIFVAVVVGWIVAARRKPISLRATSFDWPDAMDGNAFDDGTRGADAPTGVRHE